MPWKRRSPLKSLTVAVTLFVVASVVAFASYLYHFPQESLKPDKNGPSSNTPELHCRHNYGWTDNLSSSLLQRPRSKLPLDNLVHRWSTTPLLFFPRYSNEQRAAGISQKSTCEPEPPVATSLQGYYIDGGGDSKNELAFVMLVQPAFVTNASLAVKIHDRSKTITIPCILYNTPEHRGLYISVLGRCPLPQPAGQMVLSMLQTSNTHQINVTLILSLNMGIHSSSTRSWSAVVRTQNATPRPAGTFSDPALPLSKVNWTLCISSALFGPPLFSKLWLPAYFEYNLDVVRVDRIILYIYEGALPMLSAEAQGALEERVQRGQAVVTVVSEDQARLLFYRNQMSCLADCQLRCLALSNYVLVLDADEILSSGKGPGMVATEVSNTSQEVMKNLQSVFDSFSTKVCSINFDGWYHYRQVGMNTSDACDHPFAVALRAPVHNRRRFKYAARIRDVVRLNVHKAECYSDLHAEITSAVHFLHYRGHPSQNGSGLIDKMLVKSVRYNDLVPAEAKMPSLRTIQLSKCSEKGL